jgi:hypothetical protein
LATDAGANITLRNKAMNPALYTVSGSLGRNNLSVSALESMTLKHSNLKLEQKYADLSTAFKKAERTHKETLDALAKRIKSADRKREEHIKIV